MRIWSLPPAMLDVRGLGAFWRETLLAGAVLRKLANGENPGYRNHPALDRFKALPEPLWAVETILRSIYNESFRRGLKYDPKQINWDEKFCRVPVSQAQLDKEARLLAQKLLDRGTTGRASVQAVPSSAFYLDDNAPGEKGI